MNTVWNNEEKTFIRENANKMTDKEGAAKLSELSNRNISMHAWRKQRQKLGIRKANGRGVCQVVLPTKQREVR